MVDGVDVGGQTAGDRAVGGQVPHRVEVAEDPDPGSVVRGERVASRPRPPGPAAAGGRSTAAAQAAAAGDAIRARRDRGVDPGVGRVRWGHGQAVGADAAAAGRQHAPTRRARHQRRHRRSVAGDVAGHDRSASGRGTLQDAAAGYRPFDDPAGIDAEIADPDEDLGPVGRHPTRVPGDRPGVPRRWGQQRRALLDVDRHRCGHRLDLQPHRDGQRRTPRGRGVGQHPGGHAVPRRRYPLRLGVPPLAGEAASSSTTTCCAGPRIVRSPSPGADRRTRTTMPTPSRRTGPPHDAAPATSVTTPAASSACSTSCGTSTTCGSTCSTPNRS
jgi:hypothetical protein